MHKDLLLVTCGVNVGGSLLVWLECTLFAQLDLRLPRRSGAQITE